MRNETKCTIAVYEEGDYEFLSPKHQEKGKGFPEKLTGLEPGAYKGRLITSMGEVSIEIERALWLASDGFWRGFFRHIAFWV